MIAPIAREHSANEFTDSMTRTFRLARGPAKPAFTSRCRNAAPICASVAVIGTGCPWRRATRCIRF